MNTKNDEIFGAIRIKTKQAAIIARYGENLSAAGRMLLAKGILQVFVEAKRKLDLQYLRGLEFEQLCESFDAYLSAFDLHIGQAAEDGSHIERGPGDYFYPLTAEQIIGSDGKIYRATGATQNE